MSKAWLAITVTVLFGTPVYAEYRYTPVIEFHAMSREEQFTVVRSALAQVYDHFTQREPDVDKANCILDLFNNPDREVTGYDHFGVALQVALTNEAVEDITIEHLLLGIVNTQCAD